ncbi:MAG: hypothetical protein K6T31_04870 [Alicyclobacillus sp.]|nr:hypothetical protein [Alicyclobacillus sp.]
MHKERLALREMLRRRLGERTVLFLEGLHVEGVITRVGHFFVTLREDVEVESNADGSVLENPHTIHVKISKIVAISDDHGA